jgi:hypothetical protein
MEGKALRMGTAAAQGFRDMRAHAETREERSEMCRSNCTILAAGGCECGGTTIITVLLKEMPKP